MKMYRAWRCFHLVCCCVPLFNVHHSLLVFLLWGFIWVSFIQSIYIFRTFNTCGEQKLYQAAQSHGADFLRSEMTSHLLPIWKSLLSLLPFWAQFDLWTSPHKYNPSDLLSATVCPPAEELRDSLSSSLVVFLISSCFCCQTSFHQTRETPEASSTD